MTFAKPSDTEVLYPVDPDMPDEERQKRKAAEQFKMSRMARYVRGERMQLATKDTWVAIVGLLSKKILLHPIDQMRPLEQMEVERRTMKKLLWHTRDKLLEYGVFEGAIRVYVPELCIDIDSPGQVVLYALKGPPSLAKPYMTDQPAIRRMTVPSIETAMNMVYDLKGHEKEEKEDAEAQRIREKSDRYVECKIEVKIWESESKSRIVPLPGANVYLTFGANGLEEVGGEITGLRARILEFEYQQGEKKPFKLEVLMKAQGSVKFERRFDGQMRAELINKWGAKFGATLKLGGRIPKTPIHIPPIEITPYVDHLGGWGVEFQVKVYEW